VIHGTFSAVNPAKGVPTPIFHTVVSGESLWSIASAQLHAALGRPPGVTVLTQYWWQVVEINRPHLPDPANPDLLFPGDVVQLPPLPATVPSN
jgi:nucleoid-associated protein YgaU